MQKNSDLNYDEIKSIEYVGEQDTYDFVIPKTHNYFANNIMVHNCGSIEQDADIITFVYRPAYYSKNPLEVNLAELIIEKNRNGARGTIELECDLATFTFSEKRFIPPGIKNDS